MVYTYSGYLEGVFPPGKKDMGAAFKVMLNMVRGHAAAYKAIHEIQKEARVGTTINYRGFWPERKNFPPDMWMSRILSANFNEAFQNTLEDGKFKFLFRSARIPEASRHAGLYRHKLLHSLTKYVLLPWKLKTSSTSAASRKRPAPAPPVFWQTFPKACLMRSNGPMVLKNPSWYLKTVWKMLMTNCARPTLSSISTRFGGAINENCPIKGYFHWSLVDNFEWERGWTQRFGLWGLNTKTQARIRRKSVDLYAEICQQNVISSTMVEKYAPEVFSKLFPE